MNPYETLRSLRNEMFPDRAELKYSKEVTSTESINIHKCKEVYEPVTLQEILMMIQKKKRKTRTEYYTDRHMQLVIDQNYSYTIENLTADQWSINLSLPIDQQSDDVIEEIIKLVK